MNPSLSVNAYFYMSLHRLTDAWLWLCHRQNLFVVCDIVCSIVVRFYCWLKCATHSECKGITF